MAIRTSIFALLCAASLQAAAVVTPDPACVGTYRLHDGRDVDLALSGETGYRWRMIDGTSGKLDPAPDGGWNSTLGWTGRADGHRVELDRCATGWLSFDGVAGERITFDIIDTRFAVQGATLAGRLVLPPGHGPVPVVVLVHGAERGSARDDYALQRLFPAAGIGAFVYDKRGTGASGGHYTHDYLTLATDAIAASAEARRLAGPRAAAIGYQAGSQGGWVAPLAARIEPVDFVVVSFGLAVSPLEEDRAAVVLDMARHGFGPDVLPGAMDVVDATAEILRSGFRDGYDALARVRERHGDQPWFRHVRGNATHFLLEKPEAELREIGPGLFPGIPLDYDPMPVLRHLRVPQLWLLGGQDIDAPHEETERRLRRLAAQGMPIQLVVHPDAEHGMYEFETAPDGTRLSTRQPAEYFAAMRDFILAASTQRRVPQAGGGNAGHPPAHGLGAVVHRTSRR